MSSELLTLLTTFSCKRCKQKQRQGKPSLKTVHLRSAPCQELTSKDRVSQLLLCDLNAKPWDKCTRRKLKHKRSTTAHLCGAVCVPSSYWCVLLELNCTAHIRWRRQRCNCKSFIDYWQQIQQCTWRSYSPRARHADSKSQPPTPKCKSIQVNRWTSPRALRHKGK